MITASRFDTFLVELERAGSIVDRRKFFLDNISFSSKHDSSHLSSQVQLDRLLLLLEFANEKKDFYKDVKSVDIGDFIADVRELVDSKKQ